jgi:hypothetical protein
MIKLMLEIQLFPHFVGPFTPIQIELLKKPLLNPFEVPESEMGEIRKLIEGLNSKNLIPL